MRATFLFILCGFVLQAAAQSRFLKSAAQHSHNDYEQAVPFFTAYQHQFESIEADIFLANGQLVVAHDSSELKKGRLLSDLYLAPLAKVIRANQGFAYTEKDQPLPLLVDIKSEAYSTLHSLISQLQDFPDIIHCPTLRVVISRNRPREADYSRFPSFIYFDGTPNQAYTEEALNKIAMISDDFHHYSKWKGSGRLPAEEKNKLVQVIQKIHARHKPFRFWGCPDGPSAWKQFVELGVDYINTDRIERLSSFLQNASSANSLSRNDRLTLMPYNRLIRSAGKVIPFGDPALENHALDVTSLPNENLVVVEDRYSIVVLDPISGMIVDRFTFKQDARFKNFMSTYSGIKTFTTDLQTFIVWSAAEGNGSHSFLMYAQWQGKISNIGSVPFDNKSPAPNAIPNEICIANEKGITYVYVVLNGNNELVKLKWSDKSVIWKAQTGVAPYGITKANGNLYVTNWAGPLATDSTKERTGVPWGLAYTDPKTGATARGTVSIFRASDGKLLKEVETGLHPNAILAGSDGQYVYVCNGSSDQISVMDTRSFNIVETIATGIFKNQQQTKGSSPNGLALSKDNRYLYVSNGLDNAVAIIWLGKHSANRLLQKSLITGSIPTEACPAGLMVKNNLLVVANLESTGAHVSMPPKNAMVIHNQLASVSIIPLPSAPELKNYTRQVYQQNMMSRLQETNLPPRKGTAPQPVPQRLGEPSVFKHVVYIIKENKTYDQVFGDMHQGRGDSSLCVFGKKITPNEHALAEQFGWMDNYYASGKSSAEGHQWTDAAMVSDYVEKNVRAWLRSYPHRQEDALVYNKRGFIWNQAMDHGKTVRIYGEACTTVYDKKLKWPDLYAKYQSGTKPFWHNTTTIKRIENIIAPAYPDCDNLTFSNQQRATEFIKEWEAFEQNNNLPELMVLSLPNNHTVGTSPGWPTPNAMVADNDLALGRIIEKISHSRYWDSTVIFVTQDASQSGWDHISAYRTIGMVISPYSKPGVTATNYNQTSMVRTIEQILSIPPMNVIDATATPMFDCFNPVKRDFGFTAMTNNVPLDQMNAALTQLKGKERKYALESLNELFNEVDGGKDEAMNRIIWNYAKGDQKYPAIKKQPSQ